MFHAPKQRDSIVEWEITENLNQLSGIKLVTIDLMEENVRSVACWPSKHSVR